MADKPHSIIYAWNYVSWGGAQMYFLGNVKLVSQYYNVKIVLPADSDAQLVGFFEKHGAEIVTFEPSFDGQEKPGVFGKLTTHLRKWRSERAMLQTIEANAKAGSTIVHAELAPWQSLFALIWLLLRYPVFITMHNAPRSNAFRQFLWKLKMRVVSRWSNFHPLTSNKDTKEYFRGYFSDEVAERIVVTYTAVDPAEIQEALGRNLNRDEILEGHGLRPDAKLVLALGQFIDRKGRWEFLEAARRISLERDDVQFVWITNIEPTPDDEKRIEGFGIGDSFKLLKSKDVANEHVELFVFMRAADVFVLPSHVEGLPISILEAMSLGLPVISTRINAIPEAIEDGINGSLVEAANAGSLVRSIVDLLDDPEKRVSFGERARHTALEKFDERNVAKIVLQEYRKVFDV